MKEFGATSRNISLGGLLVRSSDVVPWDCDVEFEMLVQKDPARKGMRLRGQGRVVRVEQFATDNYFLVALECLSPMRRVLDEIRRAAA